MKQNMVECLSGFSALWYNKIDQKINTIDSCTENEIDAKIFMDHEVLQRCFMATR